MVPLVGLEPTTCPGVNEELSPTELQGDKSTRHFPSFVFSAGGISDLFRSRFLFGLPAIFMGKWRNLSRNFGEISISFVDESEVNQPQASL